MARRIDGLYSRAMHYSYDPSSAQGAPNRSICFTSTHWPFRQTDDEVVTDKTLCHYIYSFKTHGLPLYGVKSTSADSTDPANLSEANRNKGKIVYFEIPANPNNPLINAVAIFEMALGTHNTQAA